MERPLVHGGPATSRRGPSVPSNGPWSTVDRSGRDRAVHRGPRPVAEVSRASGLVWGPRGLGVASDPPDRRGSAVDRGLSRTSIGAVGWPLVHGGPERPPPRGPRWIRGGPQPPGAIGLDVVHGGPGPLTGDPRLLRMAAGPRWTRPFDPSPAYREAWTADRQSRLWSTVDQQARPRWTSRLSRLTLGPFDGRWSAVDRPGPGRAIRGGPGAWPRSPGASGPAVVHRGPRPARMSPTGIELPMVRGGPDR